jgi:hypothetical protein
MSDPYYSKHKDKERAYMSGQGSRARYQDCDQDDYINYESKRPRYDDERQNEERDHPQERIRKSDSYHLTKTTAATQRDFADTDIYPPKSASDERHREAAATRKSTRIDEDEERYSRDHEERSKVSWDNRDNFNEARKHGIEARDWGYDKDDPKHTKAGRFNRPASFDRKYLRD